MGKNAKIDRTQKRFLEAMKKKFMEDMDVRKYTRPKFPRPEQIDDHVTLIPYCVVRYATPHDFFREIEEG